MNSRGEPPDCPPLLRSDQSPKKMAKKEKSEKGAKAKKAKKETPESSHATLVLESPPSARTVPDGKEASQFPRALACHQSITARPEGWRDNSNRQQRDTEEVSRVISY